MPEKRYSGNFGSLPTYTSTLLICIDDLTDDIASGYIWSFCCQKPIHFCGFGKLLLTLDQILDEIGGPACWFNTVTAEQKKAEPTVYYRPDELMHIKGEISTVAIRIYSRQHASMQGELLFLGQEGKKRNFRSALELLYWLDAWLKLQT